jgi:hypothetical protein
MTPVLFPVLPRRMQASIVQKENDYLRGLLVQQALKETDPSTLLLVLPVAPAGTKWPSTHTCLFRLCWGCIISEVISNAGPSVASYPAVDYNLSRLTQVSTLRLCTAAVCWPNPTPAHTSPSSWATRPTPRTQRRMLAVTCSHTPPLLLVFLTWSSLSREDFLGLHVPAVEDNASCSVHIAIYTALFMGRLASSAAV